MKGVTIWFRIIVTVALLVLIPVLLALHGFGEIYRGFDPNPPRESQGLGKALLLFSVVPALVSVWRPHRALLITAAVLLLPLTVISVFYLIIPVVGIVAFVPLVLWYVYFFRSVDTRNAAKSI
jgi:hypothetical protein